MSPGGPGRPGGDDERVTRPAAPSPGAGRARPGQGRPAQPGRGQSARPTPPARPAQEPPAAPRRPRIPVVTVDPAPPREPVAPRWVSGALAGVQAALLSLLAVVTPALAAYVATSADPSNADVPWTRSVAVGAALWLMGHGGGLVVSGAAFTIVPLGVTALAVFSAYASARRSSYPTAGAWGAGVGAYVLAVLVVLLWAGQAGPLGAGAGAALRTLLGAALVGALGLGWGVLRPGRLAQVVRPLRDRVPDDVRAALRAGALVAALLVGVAAVVVAAWTLSGRAATGDVIVALGLDTFSGFVMAVAQLALAPNLVLWAVAWLAGPGFAVGEGTVFAPTEVVTGPMPALPMLGSLPAEPVAAGPWVPLVVVAAGALAGWWLHRRRPGAAPSPAWRPVAVGLGAGAWAGVFVAVLVGLAGGAAGPGRMAVVGAPVLLVGAVVAGLAAAGALAVAVPADPAVRAAARRAWGRLRRPRAEEEATGVEVPAVVTDDA